MGINSRWIEEADADRLAEMAAGLSAHEGYPPPPFGPPEILRYGFGIEKSFEGIVAEISGRVEAYAFFHDAFNVGLGAPGLHMIDLYVDEEARCQGIGRALVGRIALECRRRQGTWVTWQSVVSNRTALEFYDAIGGRRFGAANSELTGPALAQIIVAGDVQERSE